MRARGLLGEGWLLAPIVIAVALVVTAVPASAQVFFDVQPLPGRPSDFAPGSGSDYILTAGPPTAVLGEAPSRFQVDLPGGIVGLTLTIPSGLGAITPEGVTQTQFPSSLITPDGLTLRLYGAHVLPDSYFSVVHSSEFEIATIAAHLLPGDANNDGCVSGADFTIWADHFDNGLGPADKLYSQGDFNGDCHVTGADFTIWSDNFGLGCEPLRAEFGGTVPEPATLALAISIMPLAWAGSARSRRAMAKRTRTGALSSVREEA